MNHVFSVALRKWSSPDECYRFIFALSGSKLPIQFDPNQRDIHGRAPLHYAASSSNYEAVVALTKWEGIDVRAVDLYGDTPLSIAKLHQNSLIIDALTSAVSGIP